MASCQKIGKRMMPPPPPPPQEYLYVLTMNEDEVRNIRAICQEIMRRRGLATSTQSVLDALNRVLS